MIQASATAVLQFRFPQHSGRQHPLLHSFATVRSNRDYRQTWKKAQKKPPARNGTRLFP